MEDLWKKESAKANALYCDLLKNVETKHPEVLKLNPSGMSSNVFKQKMDEKKNEFSDHRRKEGNEEFEKDNFSMAIKYYNESLCLAEIGTEKVALAYGNRSACYLQLKKYDKCIVDIDLAVKETGCPESLKKKLKLRKDDCVKLLSTVKVDKLIEVKLSYGANRNFPFMANNLDIQKNEQFGRHIIAKSNIPAGKTIVFEDNFVAYTRSYNYSAKNDGPMKCVTCNRIAMNPIPCLKCTVVMFCSMECRNGNKIHKMDCGATYYTIDNFNNKYIIQSVLTAITFFPTINELMNFVQDAVAADRSEIPANLIDSLSKYRLFLNLWRPKEVVKFRQITYRFFNTIILIDDIRKLFNSPAKQRFLMHLVAHHAVILLYNAMQGQLSLFTSLTSHSCSPNIQEIFFDNRTACITIRPIKKGEQICCAYITEEIMKVQQLDHKDEIFNKFGFRCKCEKCEKSITSVKCVAQDPLFQQLKETDVDSRNRVGLEDFIANSIRLLNTHKRMPWSHQLEYISKRLGYCLGMFYYTSEVK